MAKQADYWRSASETLKLCRQLFEDEEHRAKRRLVQLAADEIVRTRCLRLVIRDGTQKNTEDAASLDAIFWDDFAADPTEEDWAHGVFESSRYDAIFGTHTERAHGVEFDVSSLVFYRASTAESSLSDVHAKLGDGDFPQPQVAQTAPPVTAVEARDWYQSLSAADQALGLLKLHKRANQAFSPRRVVRKIIEPFVEGRKTGRPRSK